MRQTQTCGGIKPVNPNYPYLIKKKKKCENAKINQRTNTCLQ